MRKLWCFIFICFCVNGAFAQNTDLKELLSLLDLPQSKLESHLQKKGFKKGLLSENDELPFFIKEEKKKDSLISLRCFRIIPQGKEFELTYQTTRFEEYADLKQELLKAGYTYPRHSDTLRTLFQRHNISIESSCQKIDTLVYYCLTTAKKSLPRKKDILFAEDLLQLDRQEYLIDVFGRENVKTDVFHFTEQETNRCSILYPNTSDQAIFIWNDEDNLKDIAFIIIGSDAISGVNKNQAALPPNTWSTKQGLRCGMTLREIQKMNEAPVKIYNWNAESAGYLTPDNKGSIDFSRIGMVFNCLNCAFLPIQDSKIVDSNTALQQNQKVFMTTMIILPKKKAVASTGVR